MKDIVGWILAIGLVAGYLYQGLYSTRVGNGIAFAFVCAPLLYGISKTIRKIYRTTRKRKERT